ncbi:hypothetical protein LguiB_027389 [Lonicera macranthoides]
MPSALVQWKGKVSEYKSILGLLKCIDFSSNKLVGQIPQELASLEGLISLNLSRNNLIGPTIQEISQMKKLEILDLSRNQLSGVIPIGLGSLNSLSVLDLSNNNFSGKIPRSTQLDTFNASVYTGNDKLCGFPLPLCPEDESTSFPPPNDHGKAKDTFVTTGFYVSVVLGFAIGFWGFIGPLVLRSSWRYKYFKILDQIQDWIYVTIAANTARDNERQALLNFKKEIVVDHKGRLLSSWGSQEEDCCKWRGIRCSNTTAHVILLDLHGWIDYAIGIWVGLSGKVSPSLLELNQLKYLDLSHNSFYMSPIPEFIGSLSKLQHLNLSRSGFVGRVPHQLGNLTNLRSLDLGFNFDILTVKNLEWLSDLRLLRHLDLSYIDLQKVDLLQSIDRLSFLSSLHLHYCNLPGIISPSLHLTNFSSIPLSIIDISDNRFTNSSSYNWLFNFSSSLVDVDMSSNPLGGTIPNAFGNMTSLESLSLIQCALEGEIPKSFMNLSRLRSLVLSSNNLTGQLPELFQTFFASKNSLEILELSGNKFSGSLPDFTSFSSLRQLLVYSNKLNGSFPKRFGQSSPLEYLDLSDNELNGSLPDLTSFPLLRYLDLTNNKIQGTVPESIRELSNLKTLDLSFNLLTLEFSSDWTPRFQLDFIKLSNCTLGPHFLEWLRSQSNFSFLDISSARISDTIPHWFWDLSPKLVHLNFSDNQIHGMLPDLSLKFVKLDQIDLSSNCFKGPIPLLPRNLSSLNLSKNMFSGSIISLCTIVTEILGFLDFSNNLLSGEVPNCWIDGNNLEILDLANNNFSGKMPASFGFLHRLILLNLLLDLSQNKISGNIPQCFDKLYSMIQTESSNKTTYFEIPMALGHYYQEYVLSALVQWKGKLLEYRSTLELLKCINLSSNNLVGQIPQELVSLTGLCFLNLSRNNLTGHIIQNISQMKNIEILDLSRNQLSGAIPVDLGSLNFLSILDLSSNNLSGKIPLGTQLQTFNTSVYDGNDKLCGVPLNECPEDESTSVCPSTDHGKGYTDEEDEDTFMTTGLYVSAVLGFATGFWGLFGSLMLRSSWRYAYFKILDKIQDWIYVTIAVNTARVQRKFRGLIELSAAAAAAA